MKVVLLTSLSSVISVIVDSTGLDIATTALINETVNVVDGLKFLFL